MQVTPMETALFVKGISFSSLLQNTDGNHHCINTTSLFSPAAYSNLLMINDKLILGFTGDIMIGRTVDSIIAERGYLYIWGNTLRLFHSSDINLVNLETTLTDSNKIVPKIFNFRAAPDKVKVLTEAHINVVNLANNHALDFSVEGMMETLQVLKTAGIRYVGAGGNKEEAAMPCFLEKKNFRIGILGFTDNEPGWGAGINKSGINYIDIEDKEQRLAALGTIALVRKKADVVIVSLHWGPNMQEKPLQEHITFAHEAIEAGADIIHGHSAHIFQAVEVYQNKVILYDTGDFIDDYLVDPVLKNNHSFFYKVELAGNGIEKIHLIPVLISDYQVNLATGKNFEWSINRIQALSRPFNTYINDKGEIIDVKNKI